VAADLVVDSVVADLVVGVVADLVLLVVAVLEATVIQAGFLVQDNLEGGFLVDQAHMVKIDMADQALVVLAPLVQVIQAVDLVDPLVDSANKVVLVDSVVVQIALVDLVVVQIALVDLVVVLEILGRVNLAHLVIVVAGIRMIENHFNLMKYHNITIIS